MARASLLRLVRVRVRVRVLVLVFVLAFVLMTPVSGLEASAATGKAPNDAPTPAPLTCITSVPQVFALTLQGVYHGDSLDDPAPELDGLLRFDRLQVNGTSTHELALIWGRNTPPARRGTSAKYLRLIRHIRPTAEVKEALERVEALRQETLCGEWVPYMPLYPGRYWVFAEGSAHKRRLKDLQQATLIVSSDRAGADLVFTREGKPYRAMYRLDDITPAPRALTPQQRRRGMCLRGISAFCGETTSPR